jgi:hypothetical protein
MEHTWYNVASSGSEDIPPKYTKENTRCLLCQAVYGAKSKCKGIPVVPPVPQDLGE